MSDTSQAQPPAGYADAPVDEGLSAEEQAQFAEMERATPEPGAGSEPPAEGTPSAEETAAAAAAAAVVAGDDDDDDEDGEAAPAAGTQPAAGDKPPKRRVSARKFERAEAARLALENELRTTRDNQTRLAERLNILTAALQPAAEKVKTPEDEDPEPDAEKDIFAHNAWLKRQFTKLNDRVLKSEQGQQAQTEEQTVATTYVDDARAFAAQEPNFGPAYNFLMENRTVELAQYYFGLDLTDPKCPQLTNDQVAQIKSSISSEERTLVTNAIKANKSPAASVFAMARARGFRPAAKAAAPAAAAAAPAAGAAAAIPGSLAEPPAAGGVGEEIDRIKAGSAAARSLSSGGGAPPSPLTPEKLAAMNDDDFGALLENMTAAQEAAIFGS